MDHPEEPLAFPDMRRENLDMQRQESPGGVKHPEDFFSKKGIDLPSHLSTEHGRWKSLLIVCIACAFTSGPMQSWATLEPILISEGVFAGPDQQAQLTGVYSVATGFTLCAYAFGGMLYDAVGPRAMAAGTAFCCFAGLAGIAVGIQYQSMNFLIWICYPAVGVFGSANNMGAYAWLYLLPDSQNTVASLTGAIQALTDAFVLIAVFMHNTLGLSVPFYFALCAFLALITGFICLELIPDHKLCQQVTDAVAKPDVDVEANSYGATESSAKKEVESCWDVVSRSCAALRDCCQCLLLYCPGASACFMVGYEVWVYMFAFYQLSILYPFYEAYLGTRTATTLVNIDGCVIAIFGAIGVICAGRFVDYVGFKAAIAYLNIPIILNFACLCMPYFIPQVIAQILVSGESYSIFVFAPRWCLSYVPPELYGSGFGIVVLIMGVGEMTLLPLSTFLYTLMVKDMAHHPPPALQYLTIAGLWCFLAVVGSFMYFQFLRYYPMPAPGGTTMAAVANYRKGAEEDAEAEHLARYSLSKQDVPADTKHSAQKSSTPTCAPCACLRPHLGSRAS